MRFSLRTMLLLMLALGALPAWYANPLIPFVVILIISVVMSLRGFPTPKDNDVNFS